jgi:hypothetical protein
MHEKELTEQESLLIIQQMINTAKKEQKDDGRGWIVWGWLLLAASVFTYINLQVKWVSTFFFWNWFGLIAMVLLLYATLRKLMFPGREKVRTYTRDLLNKLTIGYFVTLFFIIISINVGVPPTKGFALLIGLYGFWVLIYGAVLGFRPSIVAAFATWALGIAALFVRGFDMVMLCHAAAVISGFIVPGYMAQSEFRKIKRP